MQLEAFWLAMTQIEAQNLLAQIMVSEWPYKKKTDKDKLHKELYKAAYPKHMRTKKSITPQELQKLLGR